MSVSTPEAGRIAKQHRAHLGGRVGTAGGGTGPLVGPSPSRRGGCGMWFSGARWVWLQRFPGEWDVVPAHENLSGCCHSCRFQIHLKHHVGHVPPSFQNVEKTTPDCLSNKGQTAAPGVQAVCHLPACHRPLGSENIRCSPITGPLSTRLSWAGKPSPSVSCLQSGQDCLWPLDTEFLQCGLRLCAGGSGLRAYVFPPKALWLLFG